MSERREPQLNQMDVSDEQRDALLQKFLATIQPEKNPTPQLFVVAMVGLPGSGKSTVAQALSERLHLYVAANDKIRRFFNDEGFPGDNPLQHVLQHIAETRTKYLYEQGVSHIIDNDLLKFVDAARDLANSYGARMYLINVICPEDQIITRITARMQQAINSSNLSRAGILEYQRRKQTHAETPMPAFDFVIHSNEVLAPQIATFAQKLENDGVITLS